MRLVTGIFLIAFLAGSQIVKGQAVASDNGIIYLNKNESDSNNDYTRGSYIGPHVLGDTITMLMNKFEKEYTYYVPSGGAYSTDILKITKRPIYKAIKKINKYYEKNLRKGNIKEGTAYRRMNAVLRTAIKLNNYYTHKVEEDLDDLKSPTEMEEYLLNLKFN